MKIFVLGSMRCPREAITIILAQMHATAIADVAEASVQLCMIFFGRIYISLKKAHTSVPTHREPWTWE